MEDISSSKDDKRESKERSPRKHRRLESGVVAKRLVAHDSGTSLPKVQSTSQLPQITHSDPVSSALQTGSASQSSLKKPEFLLFAQGGFSQGGGGLSRLVA